MTDGFMRFASQCSPQQCAEIEAYIWASIVDVADAVLVVDKDRSILAYNGRTKVIFSDLEGKSLTDIFTQDSCADLQNLFQAGFNESCTAVLRSISGYQHVAIISPPNNQMIVIRLVDHSLKSMVHGEGVERLISLGRMTAELAHGMSNPLAVIQGRIELLHASFQGRDPRLDRHVNILRSQYKRIARLLQSIQVMAKSKMPFFNKYLASELFQGIFSQLTDKLKDIRIQYKIVPLGTYLFVDENHFRVIICNLIGRFIDLGCEPKELNIFVEEKNGKHCIRLELDGESPPEKLIHTIKEAARTERIPSTMVGYEIAIAFQLVHELQGNLQISARHPKGTLIELFLPTSAYRSVLAGGGRSEFTKESYNIMVVDDHSFLRETLVGLLSTEGHRIIGASTAEEALQSLDQLPLDFVLVDIRLPGMNGEQFLLQLQELRPQLARRVILISGADYEPPAGVPFLRKPFTKQQMIEEIERLID